ncbi:similar to UBX domain containing 1, isoform CRA_d [Rattus norvegicus]|uniref:Similar to UBX domain containing 1, isoform CRA_d n=1 Tax=Rattus norvegicus TaxID=10116 RepID=A6KR09_RAT|nr:similar to UBX domain containing 1, isoform CRA_d [Rattus norvegicus]
MQSWPIVAPVSCCSQTRSFPFEPPAIGEALVVGFGTRSHLGS